MKCKYCGKDVNYLTNHELNGKICESCSSKLWEVMSFQDCSSFESALNRMGLNDAFTVVKRYLDTEFSIVRFYEFREDTRLKYDKVLVYIVVKEMDMGCQIVKFPLIVEVKLVGEGKNSKLKMTTKDGSRSRDIYIFGKIANDSLTFDSKELRSVKTDMSRVERELKDFLKMI